MRNLMKRFLCFALCALLVLGVVPVRASAALPPPIIPPVDDTYENDPATCTHETGELYMVYPNDTGRTHTFVWSCCGGTVVEDHAREQVGDPVPPTCGEYGYTVYYCGVCGEYFEDDMKEPLSHTGTETGVKEPTCTDMGYEYFICDRCGVTVITEAFSSTGHTPGQVAEVVAPTCERDGYTRYICAVCGEIYTDDVTPATGHCFMANGICLNCGLDSAKSIIINMTHQWNSGWGRNCIVVYEDGVQIGIATIEYGKGSATWSYEMDPQKEYRFYWEDGQSAKDCAFTISIMGEVVFSAEYGDCAAFTYGQMLYPFCDHDYVPTNVTPPNCLSYGYTTYTCTLCGTSYDGDLVDPVHHYDDGVVVLPTCTTGGYTLYTCSYCRNSYATDLTDPAHSYEGGKCTGCGETVTISPLGFTLSFEDEILVNMYYTISDTADVEEQGMLMFYANPGTVDYSVAGGMYSGKYVPASDRFIATTDGIAAKQMGDDRYYCAYAKLSDGTYVYSALYQYSPKKYAMNMLPKDSTTSKQKALCVAMLNYGAAAQQYFNYRTWDLMNAGLTNAQKALVQPYSENLFGNSFVVDPGKLGDFAYTTGYDVRQISVSFEGAFTLNYYATSDRAVAGDMKIYVWNARDYAAVSTLTAENATQVITMEKRTERDFWAQITGIAAKEIDDNYYLAVVYTDTDGNVCCSGTTAYSLSKYCRNQTNGTMGDLAKATAMYGYYAAEYFAN